ncbi:MAG TPA: transposase [Acidobacteriaceae bacterium]|nr:transposase [Acidobacteriaceae bacterium]
MTRGLIRYQRAGHDHFITFSCFQRRPLLESATARALFENALEGARLRYGFCIFGYVIMPEHVHLLVTEPRLRLLSTAVQAMKISVAMGRSERPFWQPRYYDFNVFTRRKRIEKLRYIHRNPIRRGLVDRPEDWTWSSYRHYLTGEPGPVEIESAWTEYTRRVNGK